MKWQTKIQKEITEIITMMMISIQDSENIRKKVCALCA